MRNTPQTDDSPAADDGVCERLRETASVSVPSTATASPSDRDRLGRFAKGNGIGNRFGAGNDLALVHGLRRRNELADLPEVEADLARRRDAVLTDLGGREKVSAVQARLIVDFARVDFLLDELFGRVLRRGIFTESGRTRAAFDRIAPLLDRKLRLAQTLGLQRVAKDVPNLEDYLRQRYGPSAATSRVDVHSPQDASTASPMSDMRADADNVTTGQRDALPRDADDEVPS